MPQLLIVLGGLAGAAGVALAAAAAHRGGGNLQTAALFLMVHAPVLLAVGLAGNTRAIALAALALAAGVVLFTGDLVARDMMGGRLFPYAAPLGGGLTILSWLTIAAVAVIDRG